LIKRKAVRCAISDTLQSRAVKFLAVILLTKFTGLPRIDNAVPAGGAGKYAGIGLFTADISLRT